MVKQACVWRQEIEDAHELRVSLLFFLCLLLFYVMEQGEWVQAISGWCNLKIPGYQDSCCYPCVSGSEV